MKRSEVVDKLADILTEQRKDMNNGSDYQDAETILTYLEMYVRMLPPYREKTEKEMELVDCINQYSYCHRWENE